MRREAKEEGRAGLMQSAAKKRPSFSGEIHFEKKENRAKSRRVPTATVLLLFSGPIRRSSYRGNVGKWPPGYVTPLSERREKRDAPANSSALIKFFLFALRAVTSFGSSTRANVPTYREPFIWCCRGYVQRYHSELRVGFIIINFPSQREKCWFARGVDLSVYYLHLKRR